MGRWWDHLARCRGRQEMGELPQRPTRQNSRDVPVHARGRDLRDNRHLLGPEHLHAARGEAYSPATPSHYGDAAAQRRARVESRVRQPHPGRRRMVASTVWDGLKKRKQTKKAKKKWSRFNSVS